MRQMQITYEKYENDDFIEVSFYVPAKNEVCGECEGEGKVDHPAFSNGITQSEREEMGEEDFQSYMDGRYDVVCPCCKGMRVIQVPDVYQMSWKQKRDCVLARRAIREEQENERYYQAERAAEMRFGC